MGEAVWSECDATSLGQLRSAQPLAFRRLSFFAGQQRQDRGVLRAHRKGSQQRARHRKENEKAHQAAGGEADGCDKYINMKVDMHSFVPLIDSPPFVLIIVVVSSPNIWLILSTD